MVIEFVLDVVDDGVVRSETVRRQGIALRSVGPDDQRRAGDFARIGADIRVGAIADAGTQPIT